MDLLSHFEALTQNCNTFKSQVCTELGSPFHTNKDLLSAVCRYVTVQYIISALMFTQEIITISGRKILRNIHIVTN